MVPHDLGWNKNEVTPAFSYFSSKFPWLNRTGTISVPCIDSNKYDRDFVRHVPRGGFTRVSQIQNFCDISYVCIMMDFFFLFSLFFSIFLFFSLPLPFFVFSRYSGIPETFALFMRVRLKPRRAVYHLNEKY